MNLITHVQREAKQLRLELTALGAPGTLSPSQSLNLAARVNGHTDWANLVAAQRQRYFYERHEPYQPCSPSLVKSFSVRKAALDDLGAVEAQLALAKHPEEPQGPHWIAVISIERALRQSRELLQNDMHDKISNGVLVAPELLRALTNSVMRNLSDLRSDQASAESNFSQATLPPRTRGVYQMLTAGTDSYIETYHAAYLRWRLADMSTALCAICERKEASLAALVAQRTDMFEYVGRALVDHPDTLLTAVQRQQVHALGKVVLTSVLTNGSMEPSLLMASAFSAPNGEALTGKLLQRFPEIAFWHAWVELKPVLALGIDGPAA